MKYKLFGDDELPGEKRAIQQIRWIALLAYYGRWCSPYKGMDVKHMKNF